MEYKNVQFQVVCYRNHGGVLHDKQTTSSTENN